MQSTNSWLEFHVRGTLSKKKTPVFTCREVIFCEILFTCSEVQFLVNMYFVILLLYFDEVKKFKVFSKRGKPTFTKTSPEKCFNFQKLFRDVAQNVKAYCL